MNVPKQVRDLIKMGFTLKAVDVMNKATGLCFTECREYCFNYEKSLNEKSFAQSELKRSISAKFRVPSK